MSYKHTLLHVQKKTVTMSEINYVEAEKKSELASLFCLSPKASVNTENTYGSNMTVHACRQETKE